MKPNIYLFSISSHPDAISINSLQITFLKPQINFSNYDYFIITSKQASEALRQYDKEDYLSTPALCISLQSAKSYEALGGEILAVGGGYGDTLQKQIKNQPKTKKWLYLKAKIVASDFVAQCKDDGYMIDEAIVYESDCSDEILNVKVEKDATLIFTSPSSLKCFLKTHEISQNNRIIVIGKTTAKAIPSGYNYHICEKTTIESCIQLAYI
jgi:uroporphyrinogen-III synthase